jgi:transcription-repair coupling factor (superfamily II helicase)
MLEELIDRFGEPPKSVQNLLTIACLRGKAHQMYIQDIVQKGKDIRLTMYERADIDPSRIPELITNLAPALKFQTDPKNPYFTYLMQANSNDRSQNALEVLERILSQMEILRVNREQNCSKNES